MRQREKLTDQKLKITELRKEFTFMHQECDSEFAAAAKWVAVAERTAAIERDDAAAEWARGAIPSTICQHLKGYLPGCGKWKKIAYELFNMRVLEKEVIQQALKHTRTNAYTKMTLAEAADRVPGVSLREIEGFRNIQNAKKGSQHMIIWYYGPV
jgi:hypothetical protein